jgi:hypothetical protein
VYAICCVCRVWYLSPPFSKLAGILSLAISHLF